MHAMLRSIVLTLLLLVIHDVALSFTLIWCVPSLPPRVRPHAPNAPDVARMGCAAVGRR